MSFDSKTGLVSLTVAELASAIASALKEVKIYVLESEISAAQNAVRAVVEQANITQYDGTTRQTHQSHRRAPHKGV